MALGIGFVTWLQALSPEDPGRRLLLDPAPAPVGPGQVSGLSEFGSGKPFQESAEQLGLLWECARQPQSGNPLPPISIVPQRAAAHSSA